MVHWNDAVTEWVLIVVPWLAHVISRVQIEYMLFYHVEGYTIDDA